MTRSEKISRRTFLKLLAGGILLAAACSKRVTTNHSENPGGIATMTGRPTTDAGSSAAFRVWGQEDIQLGSLDAVYSLLG